MNRSLWHVLFLTLVLGLWGFTLGGCKLDDNRLKGSIRGLPSGGPPPEDSLPPTPPDDLLLKTESFLAYVQMIASEGITPIAFTDTGNLNSPIAPPLAGATASGSGLSPILSLAPLEKAGNTPPQDAPVTSEVFSPSYVGSIAITGDFPPSTSWQCQTLSPFAHIPCTWPSFNVLRSDLATLGELKVEIYPEEQPERSAISPALQTHSFRVRQISNTNLNNSFAESPKMLQNFDDQLYFFGFNNFSAFKLFKYDPVTETIIQPFSHGSANTSDTIQFTLTRIDGQFYYVAYTGSPYRRVFSWREGDAQPRRLSNTFNEPLGSDQPKDLISYNGKLYFTAWNRNSTWAINEIRKWYSYDPTATAGSQMLQRINTTEDQTLSDEPEFCAIYNGKLFFSALNPNGQRKLYSFTDPTSSLVQISNTRQDNLVSDDIADCHLIDNKLYFVATNSFGASKIFVYDDSLTQLRQLSNTRDDNSLSDFPTGLFVHDENLYFSSQNAANVSKLHRYDGSKIIQISNTSGADSVTDMAIPKFAHGSNLYFHAINSAGGRKLFSYDTDTGTTRQLSNTRGDQSLNDLLGGQYGYFAAYNERVYFWARNSQNVNKLHFYDPTVHQLAQISNTRGDNGIEDNSMNTSYGHDGQLLVINNILYFIANNSAGARKVFSLCDEGLGC